MTRPAPPSTVWTRVVGRCRARGGRGLVLIEVLAYVALLGLLAGGVAVSSRAVRNGGGMERVEAKLGWLDAAARRVADTSDSAVALDVDLIGQEMAVSFDGRVPQSADYRVTWPNQLKLQQVWASRRHVVLGDAWVRFGEDGLSETYGLEFYDQRRAESTWLLVVGGSGQFQRLRDRAAMKEVFDALSRRDFN